MQGSESMDNFHIKVKEANLEALSTAQVIELNYHSWYTNALTTTCAEKP
jgi:hypothetical protein